MSLSQPVVWSMAAMLRDSVVVVAVVVVAVVVRTRPRAIPLAMITMRKSTHGFPFVSHIWVIYGAPLGFGPPELCYYSSAIFQFLDSIYWKVKIVSHWREAISFVIRLFSLVKNIVWPIRSLIRFFSQVRKFESVFPVFRGGHAK